MMDMFQKFRNPICVLSPLMVSPSCRRLI